ncbi:MAG: hypothetical protein JWR58_5249, partial [Pseudonocardia sp.]|nr:hypothetical protein [Pseudonocardia sp.]
MLRGSAASSSRLSLQRPGLGEPGDGRQRRPGADVDRDVGPAEHQGATVGQRHLHGPGAGEARLPDYQVHSGVQELLATADHQQVDVLDRGPHQIPPGYGCRAGAPVAAPTPRPLVRR